MIRLHRCSSSPHNRERGAVLLVVLVMTVLLALFAVQAMRTMQVDLRSATFYQGYVEAESLALSGLEYVKMLLAEDATRKNNNGKVVDGDHLLEPWACASQIAPSPFASGRVEFSITDESSLFPVNAITQADWREAFIRLLDNLLEKQMQFTFEREEVCKKIAFRLQDWIDINTKQEGEFGRESYEAFDRKIPIRTKNAKLLFVSEVRDFLFLQKDLAEEAGMELDAFVQTLYFPSEMSEMSGKKGLKDLLTTHSNEKVNVNTARKEVLVVLFTGQEQAVEDFTIRVLAYRENPDNEDKLESLGWLETIKKDTSQNVSWQASMFQSASNYYSVKVSGITPKGTKQALAFLVRSKVNGKGKMTTTYREMYVPEN